MQTTTRNSLVTFGINSICQDGKHIIFIDFDNKQLDIIKNIIKELQKDNDLSDFYIFSTFNGYHAICLDKLNIDEIIDILCEYEFIDQDYLRFAHKRNNFTLRWGIDKEFCYKISRQSFTYKKSYAHYIFLRDVIGISLNHYSAKHYDISGLLEIQAYRSEKNGWANIEL